MQPSLRLLYRLYYGKARRIVRAVLRRFLQQRRRVFLGPLRGWVCEGNLENVLGIYELHVQQVFHTTLMQGDVVYDVGGHHGYQSLLASKLVGDTGQVYVFEPLPENRDAIARVVSANGCRNCSVVGAAVSDRVGRTPLFLGINDTQPSLLTEQGLSVIVETTTLDGFASGHRRPTLVKIDVEGAEHLVLLGARHLLETDPPITWVIELHTSAIREPVRRIFDYHRYHVEDLPPVIPRPSSGIRHIIARRTGLGRH